MSIPSEIKVAAYQKTQGICILCGKKVPNDTLAWTVEHYVPRAVYKWVSEDGLKLLLESPVNLFIVHAHCNNLKDASLPTLKRIRALHAAKEVKSEITHLYKKVEKRLHTYHQLKKTTWHTQNCKCAFCDKLVSLNDTTLRRKNNDFPRSLDNAMCLCFDCNVRAGKLEYKNHMVKRKKIQ